MAEYKGIKGFKVQTVSTDPAASIIATGTWASGGDLNTARGYGAGSGTQTAAFVATGGTGPATTGTGVHEQYNGTSWTETTDVNTSRSYAGGFGITTAGIVCGGYNPPGTVALTESWNGSAWTEVNDMNAVTQTGALGGTSTAGFSAGGYVPGATPTYDDKMELWDGTSWTETTDMNTGRFYGASSNNAPQSATIVFGGGNTATTANAETWNGSAWTEVADLNTARQTLGGAGGSQDSAIAFAGNTGTASVANTESWDGTSWTEVNDLSTARDSVNGAGISSGALCAGGFNPTATGATEEWTTTPAPTFQQENLGQVFYNSTSNAFKVTKESIPGGTWASGDNMNEPRQNLMGQAAGSKTAALVWGGKQAPPASITKNESYNGSSWTEVNDLNSGRQFSGGGGTQTAALAFGNASSGITESWDGTSWTEVNDLNTGRNYVMWSGIQTSALAGAGYTTTMVNNTETWDGTSWTEVSEVNQARDSSACAGQSNTAGLIAGGYSTFSPPTNTANTEIWNGTAWTEVNNLNRKTRAGTGGGTTTSAFCAGGQDDPPSPPYQVTVASVEYWNGTTWTEINDLSTAVTEHCGRGGTSGAFTAGGAASPAGLNTMEIWTAEALNSTLTAS